MIDRLHKWLAAIALFLGLIHCGLAFGAPNFTIDLLWFIGSGAAIVCVALSNLLSFHAGGTKEGLNLFLQNAIITSFFAAAWIVFPMPQVILGGGLFAAMTILVVVKHRKSSAKLV